MDKRLKCKMEGCFGTIIIDTDSFETNVENVTEDGMPELSATVKGYCDICESEHIYSIQAYADVTVKP